MSLRSGTKASCGASAKPIERGFHNMRRMANNQDATEKETYNNAYDRPRADMEGEIEPRSAF